MVAGDDGLLSLPGHRPAGQRAGEGAAPQAARVQPPDNLKAQSGWLRPACVESLHPSETAAPPGSGQRAITVNGYHCLLSALTQASRSFSALVHPTFVFLFRCCNVGIDAFVNVLGATARASAAGSDSVPFPSTTQEVEASPSPELVSSSSPL